MIATNDNLKRAFQQMHDAAIDAFATTNPKNYRFGAAVSFITTTSALTNQLRSENRLPTQLEATLKTVVSDAVSANSLVITFPDTTQNATADPDGANLRHLRNCFGHGNWRFDPAQINSGNMQVTLEDYRPNGTQSWGANMQLPDLINLAERLLVETFNGMMMECIAQSEKEKGSPLIGGRNE